MDGPGLSDLHKPRASAAIRARAESDLACIAEDAWSWAEQVEEPVRLVRPEAEASQEAKWPVGRALEGLEDSELVIGTEEDARTALSRLLADDRIPAEHHAARQVIRLILGSPLLVLRSRIEKADNTRHWAIWRMMTQLLEWTEFDPAKACRGACQEGPRCPSFVPHEPISEASPGHCEWPRPCSRSIAFVYPTIYGAASAVVRGFALAKLHTQLTPDSVRRHYDRHFQNR